jgi:AcrR family transcriptional regulator
MPKKTSLRAIPRQARGQRRIDKLLEAAAKLFAKVGYEETSTNAIAREARTSIGSLYQFFPNKEAILDALAARYLKELRAVQDAMMGEDAVQLSLPDLYDRIIQSIAGFHASHPGFQPLFYGSTTSKHLAAAADQLKQECIRRVDGLMAARNPEIDPTRRKLLATMKRLEEKKTLLLDKMGEVLEEFDSRKQQQNAKRAIGRNQ